MLSNQETYWDIPAKLKRCCNVLKYFLLTGFIQKYSHNFSHSYISFFYSLWQICQALKRYINPTRIISVTDELESRNVRCVKHCVCSSVPIGFRE